VEDAMDTLGLLVTVLGAWMLTSLLILVGWSRFKAREHQMLDDVHPASND
jgi:hypothetical protein